jgi:hypothetical protein
MSPLLVTSTAAAAVTAALRTHKRTSTITHAFVSADVFVCWPDLRCAPLIHPVPMQASAGCGYLVARSSAWHLRAQCSNSRPFLCWMRPPVRLTA